MKFTAAREALLKPLQAVIGVVERRQTMPILSNVLIIAKDGQLAVTATDLEVELVAQTEIDSESDGEITVSGRKLLDICRALPEGAEVGISLSGEKLSVRAGRSKFNLVTLPAAEFPVVEDIKAGQTITVSQESLGRLIEKTHFCMAQQDVRYYLNGMLLETGGKQLRAVATDGHRLALCKVDLEGDELDILVTLVSAYEDKHFPISISDPVEAIKFRMDQLGLEDADLTTYIGARSKVSEVLNLKRPLSLPMIRRLSEGLNIPAENLIHEYSLAG